MKHQEIVISDLIREHSMARNRRWPSLVAATWISAFLATSILVTHDVRESFEIADYIYFVSAGVIVAEGSPETLRNSADPFVRQFTDGETDGPVPFHYPAAPYERDLDVGRGA